MRILVTPGSLLRPLNAKTGEGMPPRAMTISRFRNDSHQQLILPPAIGGFPAEARRTNNFTGRCGIPRKPAKRKVSPAVRVSVVALDLPTSHQLTAPGDEFTGRIFAAINAMLLDMLAAMARKDYEDRRRRQAQGIAKAKDEDKYRGRPENVARNAGTAAMLRAGESWSAIQRATDCSRATIAKIAKRAA